MKNTEIWEPTDPTQDNAERSEIETWLDGGIQLSNEDVVELCTALSPFEYDQHRDAIAKKLGVRISTLDGEVHSNRRTDFSAESPGTAIDWPDIIPWPQAVNGVELLDELSTTIKRYLVLPSGAAETLALWIVHTYAHEAAFVSPYLAFTSPEKRCGKTIALELVGVLVPKPLPASNITHSALFRAVEAWRPTLLINEADTFLKRNEELAGILNSGHTKANAYVVRAVLVGDDYEPRRFSTWAPKAIAQIGEMKDTLRDRSIVVTMRRKTREETVEPLRLDKIGEFETLRQKLTRWVTDHFIEIKGIEPEVPGELNDRAADNWRPLLSIADVVGGEWLKKAQQAAKILSGFSDADNDSIKVQLLQDIHDAFEGAGYPDSISTEDLLKNLNDAKDRPWCEWKKGNPMSARGLASLLKPFGVRSKDDRFEEGVKKGYRFQSLEDAFRRYIPTQSATSATEVFNSDLEKLPSATNPTSVADKKYPITNIITDVADVADKNPIPAERICKDVDFIPMVKTQMNHCCDCCHFMPDPLNPPHGIGKCKLDAPYGPNDPARYPKAGRYCKQFQEAEMVT